jgi:hypothetical protein
MTPAPIETVLAVWLTMMALKRAMEICTPEVDEKPGLVA